MKRAATYHGANGHGREPQGKAHGHAVDGTVAFTGIDVDAGNVGTPNVERIDVKRRGAPVLQRHGHGRAYQEHHQVKEVGTTRAFFGCACRTCGTSARKCLARSTAE